MKWVRPGHLGAGAGGWGLGAGHLGAGGQGLRAGHAGAGGRGLTSGGRGKGSGSSRQV